MARENDKRDQLQLVHPNPEEADSEPGDTAFSDLTDCENQKWATKCWYKLPSYPYKTL